jgi:hypothetical protein
MDISNTNRADWVEAGIRASKIRETPTSSILNRGLTPDQVREIIARKDRQGWFPARHASGDLGILSRADGREVALCGKEADREFILSAAHHMDALKTALSVAAITLRSFQHGQADLGLAEEIANLCDATLAPLLESRPAVPTGVNIGSPSCVSGTVGRDAPAAQARRA